MTEYDLPVEEIPDGERITIELEGKEISVFNVEGEYYAYLNWCAHQGGPACEGVISGTMENDFDKDDLEDNFEWCREGEILNCPWHAWEYDITTGECLSRTDVSLPSYPVRKEDGKITVDV